MSNASLPEVVSQAWKRIGSLYVIGDLSGPAEKTFLNRPALQWSAVQEIPEDLIGVDIIVFNSNGEIPGFEKTRYGTYYRSGLAAFDGNRGDIHREFSASELNYLHPGARIRVNVGNMAKDNLYHSVLKAYRPAEVDALVTAISKGLDMTSLQRREN